MALSAKDCAFHRAGNPKERRQAMALWAKSWHTPRLISKVARYRGGGVKHDYSVYSISEKWRQWQPGTVIKEKAINGKTGWQSEKN